MGVIFFVVGLLFGVGSWGAYWLDTGIQILGREIPRADTPLLAVGSFI